jgi:hypothetical protein
MIGEIQYFSKPDTQYRDNFRIGQFFLAPIPYLLERKITYLTLDYFDKDKPSNSNFKTEINEISSLQDNKLPSIPEVGFDNDTFLPILQYKFRPVICVTNPLPIYREYHQSRGEFVIVVPIYSLVGDDGFHKVSQNFINCVQAYIYPSLF